MYSHGKKIKQGKESGCVQDNEINDEKDFRNVAECDFLRVLERVAIGHDDEVGDNKDPSITYYQIHVL